MSWSFYLKSFNWLFILYISRAICYTCFYVRLFLSCILHILKMCSYENILALDKTPLEVGLISWSSSVFKNLIGSDYWLRWIDYFSPEGGCNYKINGYIISSITE